MSKEIKRTVLGIILGIGFLFLVGVCGSVMNHRSIDATITNVQITKDGCEVEATDVCGNVWNFYSDGASDYFESQKVKLIFDTNTTDYNIKDDKLIDVR